MFAPRAIVRDAGVTVTTKLCTVSATVVVLTMAPLVAVTVRE